MAKPVEKSDRSDPRKNKSLAIRTVLQSMPDAKAADVAEAVKKQFGHTIAQNMVYMVKTKGTMATNRKAKNGQSINGKGDSPMNTAGRWVEAIRMGRQLLKATGSIANAIALLEAIDAK